MLIAEATNLSVPTLPLQVLDRSCHGCGQLTINTASAKKRKLGKRNEFEHDPLNRQDLVLSATTNSRPSSLLVQSHRSSSDRSSIRSLSRPPSTRPLRAGLQTKILEGYRRAGSEGPDTTPTGASSPSTAYADLTLNESVGGDMAGASVDHEGNPPSYSATVAGSSPQPSTGVPSTNDDPHQHRSSSPAIKRPASELDDEVEAVSRVTISNGEGSSLKTITMPDAEPGSTGSDHIVDLARRPALGSSLIDGTSGSTI